MEKAIKRFDFKCKPRRVSKFWGFVAKTISRIDLKKRKFVCRRHNTEGLKAPFIVLANHASLVDMEISFMVTHPNNINNVASIEVFHDFPEWLMRKLGVIGKRKFTKDLYLLKNIKYSLDTLHSVFYMYPEARYSLDGCTSFLPDSLGKMLKLFKVPVVVVNMKGNFVTCPQWNKKDKHTHVEADFTQVLTVDDLKKLSVEEINERIKQAFVYDDFAWQKANKIKIDDEDRAKGLHSLLYQCPHCGKEHEMYSEGTKLWCAACGKSWQMTEYGELVAENGETEFSHIPDWFKWERKNVREQVRNGTYRIEDDVRIDTMPNARGFIKQGTGHFVQDCTGMTLTGVAYGEPFTLKKEGCSQESVHIEYAYKYGGDVLDITTENENYWTYPLNLRDVITKVAIATEEIYLMNKERVETEKTEEAKLAAARREDEKLNEVHAAATQV